MNRVVNFFKSSSPILLIGMCIGLGIFAKLIESKFTDIAMAIQLTTFIVFIYALKKGFDKMIKK